MAFITILLSAVSKVRVWIARTSSWVCGGGTPVAQPAARTAATRSRTRPACPRALGALRETPAAPRCADSFMEGSEPGRVIREGLDALVRAELDGHRQRPLGGAGRAGGVPASENQDRAVVQAAGVGSLAGDLVIDPGLAPGGVAGHDVRRPQGQDHLVLRQSRA